jgi:hypothetical protein
MRTDALFQFGSVSPDPAKEGRVVHLDAAIGEHAFQIAIADRDPQVPANRAQDDLGRELPPLNGFSLFHFTASLSQHTPIVTHAEQTSRLQ